MVVPLHLHRFRGFTAPTRTASMRGPPHAEPISQGHPPILLHAQIPRIQHRFADIPQPSPTPCAGCVSRAHRTQTGIPRLRCLRTRCRHPCGRVDPTPALSILLRGYSAHATTRLPHLSEILAVLHLIGFCVLRDILIEDSLVNCATSTPTSSALARNLRPQLLQDSAQPQSWSRLRRRTQ
jgi:hypothetical protein